MNKQVLDVVQAVSYEMEVDKEVIFEAIEAALEAVTQKRYAYDINIKVDVDRKSGTYRTFRYWVVVADDADEFYPEKNILLSQAQKKDPELKIGSIVREPVESVEFGRIAVQVAKQKILSSVRAAKQAKVTASYYEKLHQLITGVVKKIVREGVILDVGNNAEIVIPKEKLLPGESIRVDDRVRAYLYEISSSVRGPRMYATRTGKKILKELFSIEVPEIGEEIIEIKAIARDAGARSKIAVKTNDGRIDPIGACVGMRGSRVQAISNELNNERIDIVLWDDNPAQLVINAMAPAEVLSIVIDEDKHAIDIAVDKNQLAQAIGKNGQNVKLASELTGWILNVMSSEEFAAKGEKESKNTQTMFIEKLDIDEQIAEILVREGFMSLEEIAYVPASELGKIPEFDEEIITELRNRAKEILAQKNLRPQPSSELLNMKGMTEELAYKLAEHNIKSMEDLAELAVDDLIDIDNALSEQDAGKLIMTAREPWFK